MSSILNIAVSGLNDARTRIANATSNIVNALSTNFQPQDVITLSDSVAGNNLGVSTFLVPRSSFDTTTAPPATSTSPTYAPIPTSAANIIANLPASAPVGFTSTPTTVQIFDNLGTPQNLSLTFTKTGIDTYNVNVTAVNGASTNGPPPVPADYSATVPVTFNSTTNPGTLASVASGSNYTVNQGQITLPLSYPGAGTQNVTLSLGSPGNSDGLTQFADTNVTVYSFTQNGNAYGPISTAANTNTAAAFAGNGVDLASELVSISVAQTSYGADAAVIKIANKLEKALIDIKT